MSRHHQKILAFAAAALASASFTGALQVDVDDESSIKEVAGEIAKGLYAYHDPSATTGQFKQPQPWFWWLSGSGWTGLLDYTVYTTDTTYKEDILSALAKNVGPDYDFKPPEQANWEANDDQMYWVYAALTAMEYDFEALPDNSWLDISINAWKGWVDRWNEASDTCGGGLKWQWNTEVDGFYYKNSVTNGGFFQASARLARFTGNETYAQWATKIWDWSTSVGLVNDDFHVYDGTSDKNGENCSSVNHDEWSYNIASYLHGAANMFNYVDGNDKEEWESRVKGLFKTINSTFFTSDTDPTGIMYEQLCEKEAKCTTDQTSFKSSLSRWLGKTAILVPNISGNILDLLKTSAEGAARNCNNDSTCGVQWYTDQFDGQSDFGTQLSALEVVQSLLVKSAPKLGTAGS